MGEILVLETRDIKISGIFCQGQIRETGNDNRLLPYTNYVGRLFYKTTQGKGVQNIQGIHNGLQTHITIGINPSFNQGACWK